MRIWKLVSGILCIVLFGFIIFQSCAAGVVNAVLDNGDSSGTAGAIVAVLMLVAGIVSIATRNYKGKGGDIALLIMFGIAAGIGFAFAGIYGDLRIWAGWCAICAIMAIISLVISGKSSEKQEQDVFIPKKPTMQTKSEPEVAMSEPMVLPKAIMTQDLEPEPETTLIQETMPSSVKELPAVQAVSPPEETQMPYTLSIPELEEEFEDIISQYQRALDAMGKEKEKALLQADLYKAKAMSFKAERDTLVTALKKRWRPEDVLDSEELSAEPKALEQAKKRIERLEAERDSQADSLRQADERIRELEGQLKDEDIYDYPEENLGEMPLPDFEDQKQVLMEMQEELALLEEQLRKENSLDGR